MALEPALRGGGDPLTSGGTLQARDHGGHTSPAARFVTCLSGGPKPWGREPFPPRAAGLRRANRLRRRPSVWFVIRGQGVTYLGVDPLSMLTRLLECRALVRERVPEPPAVALAHVVGRIRPVSRIRKQHDGHMAPLGLLFSPHADSVSGRRRSRDGWVYPLGPARSSKAPVLLGRRLRYRSACPSSVPPYGRLRSRSVE
jgi:hypothetical protein